MPLAKQKTSINRRKTMSWKLKIRDKTSGLIYFLWPNDGGYYLSTDDGMVPSGQQIYEKSIEEFLKAFPQMEIIT
jgi:hypothetical protein